MHTPRILLVITSADRVGGKPTGAWLDEVVAPYYAFVDAKYEVTLASPKGGAVPMDATSLQKDHATASTRRYDADKALKKQVAETVVLATIDPAAYDAVFFAGGRGAMADFPVDAAVKGTVEHFYATGKPLSSVCHGQACLVGTVKRDGAPLIAGHHFTCWTDAEETAVGGAELMPFLLESRLRAQGGVANTGRPFASHVVIEGALITAQNPASAIPAAEAVIHHLRSHQAGLAA